MSVVVNPSSVMAEEGVEAAIVRLKGIVAISKMPLSNSMSLVSNFFEIFRKELFFGTHSDWTLKGNRITSKSISKSITASEKLRAGGTASHRGLFSYCIYSRLGDRSLWRNRLARSTVNRKVGGSSPPRDALLETSFIHF